MEIPQKFGIIHYVTLMVVVFRVLMEKQNPVLGAFKRYNY